MKYKIRGTFEVEFNSENADSVENVLSDFQDVLFEKRGYQKAKVTTSHAINDEIKTDCWDQVETSQSFNTGITGNKLVSVSHVVSEL